MTPADLAELLKTTAAAVLTEHDLDTSALPATVTVERPRNPEHGDYATNLALQLGKKVGANPRELAGWLATALAAADGISSADVAGPGFVNLRLDASAQNVIVDNVIGAGKNYGHSDELEGSNVNLEFVSANPTGPIHIGGTRWAAVGDALGRLLSTQGAEVVREYYFNDHGAQIDRFTNSLIAAAKGEPTPDDGYAGDYIGDIAAQVIAKEPDALNQPDAEMHETFRAIGVDLMFTHIKESLHEFGTDFDVYTHEDSMHTSGRVDEAITRLRDVGKIYEKDGAIWLRTTDFGDDKDRVVIKSDGKPAYVAADIAYYLDKRERGADLCIYMLGADHHGYIARLKAIASSLGEDPATVEVLIGQMVEPGPRRATGADEQAGGHGHHARRPRRGDRRRRRAVLADPLVGRFTDRHRPGVVVVGVQRKPGLLRAIRPRPALGAGPKRRRAGAHRRHLASRAAHARERGHADPQHRRVPARAEDRSRAARAAPGVALPRRPRR